MSFKNNYYIAFPHTPADGDTVLFNQRNYTYHASMNNWYADGIDPDDVIGGLTTMSPVDISDTLKAGVVSYRADIDNDVNWVEMRERQQAELHLAETMAGYYPGQIAAGEVLNYTLEDLNNYIDEITWCLTEANTPSEVQWPKKPWVD